MDVIIQETTNVITQQMKMNVIILNVFESGKQGERSDFKMFNNVIRRKAIIVVITWAGHLKISMK